MSLPTLLNTRSPLADAAEQRARLQQLPLARSFDEALAATRHVPLAPTATTVLQVNVGRRCNQACHHCHVDAGPDRSEVMTNAVVDAVLTWLADTRVPTIDITGGAPEMHPRFRDLVRQGRALGRHVIDRCNLTIATLPAYADLPAFLADHGVEVIASLPSYAASSTDRQRGDGVFARSIAALQAFNAVGYGREGSGLVLNLVTNPVGAFLPGNQASLERDWKRELQRRHGIVFNQLYAITNMPISRYLEWLERTSNFASYMERLLQAFNPASVDGLMCRFTLSVGWDGRLHDCDFNQMLDLPLETRAPQTIFDLLASPAALDDLAARAIVTGPHCFGCTAGAGSSCGGTIV
jgi:radical SAM/Cys-rich protein